MKLMDKVLQEPSYGWANEQGELVVPSVRQLYKEAFSRVNIFKTKKNWVPMYNWLVTLCMMPFVWLFITRYFSFGLLAVSVVYGMMVMATHATVWYHRYCTHKAYEFSHPIWRIITQHLVIRTFPEEIYVVSHHVHHALSDKPGDPYNPKAGLMYCMLADVNHQSIAKNLNEEEFAKTSRFLKHSGVYLNSYAGYQNWGSVTHPLHAVMLWVLNWAFWLSVFFVIGGFPLICALYTGAVGWFILVRAFNYTGHGKGTIKHVDGIDFDRRNLSINQTRPGLLCGEWHNNHHLYPRSARAGFLPFQLDVSWMYIFLLYKMGAVSSYFDNKQDFLNRYHSAAKI